MLARIGITGGGTPREIQDDVQWADWTPDGSGLAIVREVAGKSRLEMPDRESARRNARMAERPPGLARRAAWPHSWITRHGATMAAPSQVVDARRQEAKPDEGIRDRGRPRLFARRLGGLVHGRGSRGQPRALGGLALGRRATAHARDRKSDAAGHLARRQAPDRPRHAAVGHPGDGARSATRSATSRGSTGPPCTPFRRTESRFAFGESGEGGGALYSSYFRSMDGSPPVRLGDGTGNATLARRQVGGGDRRARSPGGRSFSSRREPASRSRSRPRDTRVSGAMFLPDGKRLLLTASEKGQGAVSTSLRSTAAR